MKANHNTPNDIIEKDIVVTYPVKIIKLKANHNPVFLYAITILCCNLSRKNNKIESESQLRVRDAGLNCSCNLSRKNNKIESESQPYYNSYYSSACCNLSVKIIKPIK